MKASRSSRGCRPNFGSASHADLRSLCPANIADQAHPSPRLYLSKAQGRFIPPALRLVEIEKFWAMRKHSCPIARINQPDSQPGEPRIFSPRLQAHQENEAEYCAK